MIVQPNTGTERFQLTCVCVEQRGLRCRPWSSKGVLLLVLPFCTFATIHAEDDITNWFTPDPRNYTFGDASLVITDAAQVSGVDEDFEWIQSKIRALSTVYHDDVSDLAIWGGYQRSDFGGAIELPDGPVPNHVTNLRLGATYRYFGEGWMVGSSVVIQGSGDGILGGDDTGAQATLIGQYEFAEGWSVWGAPQYEGIIEDSFVIGGGIRFTNEQLDVMLGYPWSQVRWRPLKEFQIKGIYYGDPWYADVTWFLGSQWRVGVGAQQRHEGFFYDTQPTDDYQIQLRQIQLDAFVSYELPDYRYITLRIGQLVRREIFADSAYENNSANSRDIDDGWVAEFGASAWW